MTTPQIFSRSQNICGDPGKKSRQKTSKLLEDSFAGVFARVLAPLAGYTDIGFRKLAKLYGASLTVTEMVSAKGLVYGSGKTAQLLYTAEEESPACVQLFGGEPAVFAECVTHPLLSKFDIIDINMGCPVLKIVKNGEGSALLLDPKRAAAIVSSAANNTNKPVTVKIRVGFSDKEDKARGFILSDFAKMLEDAGAKGVAVHGRTREQGYTGLADRSKIAQVVRAVSIPVTANGDIKTEEDIKAVLEETGAHGVMIGRGALSNLNIFGRDAGLSRTERFQIHLSELLKFFPEKSAVNIIKPHLIKEVPRALRGAVGSATELDAIKEIIYAL